jgi:hypothetical protein
VSGWGIAALSVAGLVFLTLPLAMAQASRSGRMTRWDERVRRHYEHADRQPLEDWTTPPRWYAPAAVSGSVLWAVVVWFLTHDVAQVFVAVTVGIVPAGFAALARRQADGNRQDSGR